MCGAVGAVGGHGAHDLLLSGEARDLYGEEAAGLALAVTPPRIFRRRHLQFEAMVEVLLMLAQGFAMIEVL